MTATGGGGSRGSIDFAALNAALLERAEQLLLAWIGGGRQGTKWHAERTGKGGLGDSLQVELATGLWYHHSSGEGGGDLVSLFAYVNDITNVEAARRLMDELGWQTSAPAPPRRARKAGDAAGDERPEPPAEDPNAGGGKRKRSSLWRAITPVPANAPAPKFDHWHYTEVQASWEYRFDGDLYGYVVRFRTSEGGKEVLPHTWCVDESDNRGTRRWHWKQWEEPRPLYVPATILSGDLSLPVVLVEGEKKALAGHQLLGHEFDFVGWPGGAKAWAKAAWGWLKGRTVYLWPDCDAKRVALTAAERQQGVDPATKPIKPEAKQPGVQAMVGIGSLLVAEHGCTVYLCPVPPPGEKRKVAGVEAGGFDGWDLADAIDSGWTAANVRDFIRASGVFVPPDDPVRAKAGTFPPTMASAGRVGPAAGAGEGEGEDAALGWRGHLLTSATGAVKAVRENIVLALDGRPDLDVPGITECAALIRFNEFSNNVEKARPTPWGTPAGDWLEADELLMGDWLLREHLMPSASRQALEEAVIIVSRRHRVHPVRQQVEALRGKWDPKGPSVLDTWLRRVCMVEDEFDDALDEVPNAELTTEQALQRYLKLAGRWFVMGMCARVMTQVKRRHEVVVGPGCKFDYMLVFEGPTGWGKSTSAQLLADRQYFADTGLDVTNKDSLMAIQGIWVYEWPELDQKQKQDLGAIKSFISSAEDRFRATFDRRPAKYPRQVVFVGTTEERNYLLDHKGNRRFWPVGVTRPPDTEWMEANLQLMLAEAVWRVDQGERFYPNRDEQQYLFDPQQQLRQIESSLEASIKYWLYDENQKVRMEHPNYAHVKLVGMVELLTVVGYSIDKQTDAVVKKAASILHKMGWELKRTSLPGRPYKYYRPSTDPLPLGPPTSGSDSGGGGGGDLRPEPPQGPAVQPVEALGHDIPF